MAIDTRKFRIRCVDMDEVVPACIDLLKRFTAALREYEVTRVAVAGLDRFLAVGGNVFAVVAAKASVPILVSDKIGIRPPIDLHFGEKIFAIKCLRGRCGSTKFA